MSMFDKGEFILSAAQPEQYPQLLDIRGESLPEVAFVGRSNVGKSSLINHLTQNKNLAHVSSTPGKTQLINFFRFGDELALVDLPGYGFAKVPKAKKAAWGDLIQDYLENRKTLVLTLLLCDARHPPTKEDLLFAQWATHFHRPLFVVFTKTDKLSKGAVASQCAKHFTLLSNAVDAKPVAYLPYSIKDAKTRIALANEIKKRL